MKFAVPQDETELQNRLRKLRQETQKLNESWWTKHNAEFKEGREQFIREILKTKFLKNSAVNTERLISIAESAGGDVGLQRKQVDTLGRGRLGEEENITRRFKTRPPMKPPGRRSGMCQWNLPTHLLLN